MGKIAHEGHVPFDLPLMNHMAKPTQFKYGLNYVVIRVSHHKI